MIFNDYIWDFDGTLIDTYPEILGKYKKVLGDVEFDYEKIKYLHKRFASKGAIEYIEKNYNITREEFLKRYKEVDLEKERHGVITPIYDAIDLCKEIKRKNKRNFIVSDSSEKIFEMLKEFGILELFEEVIYRDNVKYTGKPNPNGYKYLIDKYKLECDKTLSIGDRDLDVITSQKVDIKTCLVDPVEGYSSKPDLVVKSAKELIKYV